MLAAFCWGRHWTGKCVLFEVDNSTVALALQSGSCRDPQVMRLLRLLHFVSAERQFTYTSQHIPGTENSLADAISRNSLSTAFSVQPLLAQDPCPISSCLSALVHARRQHRLDVGNLDDAVSRLFAAGIAASTARTYRCGQSRFLEFCRRLDISPDFLSEETICRFVAYLEQDRLAYGTIKCYFSAVRHLQISRGQGDLFSSRLPRLDYVLQGSRQTRPRLPITPDILRALHRHWSPRASQFDIVMLWEACCTGFFGFLRAGEFTVDSIECFDPRSHLAFTDMSVDSREAPRVISVRIKQSKTDPFRRGAALFIWDGQTNLYARSLPS